MTGGYAFAFDNIGHAPAMKAYLEVLLKAAEHADKLRRDLGRSQVKGNLWKLLKEKNGQLNCLVRAGDRTHRTSNGEGVHRSVFPVFAAARDGTFRIGPVRNQAITIVPDFSVLEALPAWPVN